MQIKELVSLIGVIEDTIIDWELREMKPMRKQIIEKVDHFLIDRCFNKLM